VQEYCRVKNRMKLKAAFTALPDCTQMKLHVLMFIGKKFKTDLRLPTRQENTFFWCYSTKKSNKCAYI